MLEITIPATSGRELWDEKNEEFVYIEPKKEQKIELEHSLISLSKWESKYCKPFISKKAMTPEEILYYVKCMTLTKNVSDDVYDRLSDENVKAINDYINAPMTATWFTDRGGPKGNSEQMTAELIYYYMIAYNIPFECEKWHLNRLMTLIRICNIKNQPQKKMSGSEIARQNAALNAQRHAMHAKKH